MERKLHEALIEQTDDLASPPSFFHTVEVGDESTGRDYTLVETHSAMWRDRVCIQNVKSADIFTTTTASLARRLRSRYH